MPSIFDNIETTNNRQYNANNIADINAALWFLPSNQRADIIGTIIEESGGNPLSVSSDGKFQGLMQWGADRYRIKSKNEKEELNNQIEYLINSINNTTDHKSWTDGGKGSDYKSYRDAYDTFNNPNASLEDGYRAFNYGYVRPTGKESSYNNRIKVVRQVYDRIKNAPAGPNYIHTEQPDATRVARPVIAKPINRYDDGGQLDTPKLWDDLSLEEKSDVMASAVRYGITTLPEIKDKWNDFAEGGPLDDTVEDYVNAIYQDSSEEPYGVPEPHYNNVNDAALALLAPDARGHYDDVVKLPNHPSSPERGIFNGQDFNLTDYGMEDPNYSLFGLLDNGDGDATLRYNDAYVIPELTVTPNGNYYNNTYDNIRIRKHSLGGNLFKNGGYVPSSSIKKRIANWEGASMKTNRSFEEEARDFNKVIPENIRNSLTQQQLDALYSYGYNVGMGNLKKRTLPVLRDYVNGHAGARDVANGMWASKDNTLRGLRNRRDWERSSFIGSAPAGRQGSVVDDVLNMDLSYLGQQQPLFEGNPTEYSTPEWMKAPEITLDDNNPTMPLERQEEPEPVNNGWGLLSLMSSLEEPEDMPFTGYEKPADRFAIGVTDNDSFLDSSWFSDGGYLHGHRFDDGGPDGSINSNYKTANLRDLTERNGLLFDTNELQVADELQRLGLEAPMLRDYSTTLPNVNIVTNRPNPAEDIDKVVLGSMALGTAAVALPEIAASAIAPVNAASDAIAGTTLGKAAVASSPTWGPLVDNAMTSYFGAEGLKDIYNGNANALTALEVVPLGRLVKPVYNGLEEVPKNLQEVAQNYSIGVPSKEGRYFRIVGGADAKAGDAIADANATGIIRSNAYANGDTGLTFTTPDGKTHSMLPRSFDYTMWSKDRPWTGSTNGGNTGAKRGLGVGNNSRIIRTKSDTGNTVWEESNKDFRHKGHAGIFRPNNNGDTNAFPTEYAEWWDRLGNNFLTRHIWRRHDFTQPNPETAPFKGLMNSSKGKPFKSELDWSPESWFEYRETLLGKDKYDAQDVAALKSHVPEYIEIERKAKANGTWLKMPDGSTWTGDPRAWVIMQSRKYKDANLTGIDHMSGITRSAINTKFDPAFHDYAWTDLEGTMSKFWAEGIPPGAVLHMDYPKSAKVYTTDAKGHYWRSLPKKIFFEDPGLYERVTEELVDQSAKHGYDVTKINNVMEGSGNVVTDVVIHPGTPKKSVYGNNGDFDMSDKWKTHLYKALIPFGLTGTTLWSVKNKDN